MSHKTNNPEEVSQPAASLLGVTQGKDEMNLAEFPIARLGRSDTRLTIEYHGQIVDKSGLVQEQTWIVSGPAKFGLPTEFAERVLIALMAITAQKGFNERRVVFTPYRILKMLRLSTGKVNYNAVKKALKQLVGVTIYSEGSFWDKAQQKRVVTEKGFHLLEDFWLKSFEDEAGVIEEETVTAYIVWGERFWDSFKAGYIKILDIDFYYSLHNTIARRLYRFLDKRMHYQDQYQIDIFDLAARLGMMQYRYASDLARKLKPAFTELIERDYLVSAEVIKVGKFKRVKFMKAGSSYRSQASMLREKESGAGGGDLGEHIPNHFNLSDPFQTFDELLAVTNRQDGSLEEKLWSAVVATIGQQLPQATHYAFFEGSKLLSLQGQMALIELINPNAKDWVEHQLSRQIKQLLYTEGKMQGYDVEKIETLQFSCRQS